jgi:hypothetical protein
MTPPRRQAVEERFGVSSSSGSPEGLFYEVNSLNERFLSKVRPTRSFQAAQGGDFK